MSATISLPAPALTATEVVARAARRGWQPDPLLTVSEWADRSRLLSPVATAEYGPWRTSRTPYLREIMDCLSVGNPAQEICFMKGAQIGATEAAINVIGYVIEHAPGPMLMVQPTLEMLKKVSKQKLAPAIAATPALRERVGPARERDSGNTLFTKEFRGGILMMATANSAAGLRTMSVRYLLLDEVDEYPGDVGGQGDPIQLAKKRTNTYRLTKKCLYISTPKRKGLSRIERLYEGSDQRRYFIPCPECGHMDFLTWSGFRDFLGQYDGDHHFIAWEEGKPETAHMVCGACRAQVEESQKTWMLEHGEWRALEPGPGKMAGFHLSGLYSPFGWYSWSEAASDFLAAKKNVEEFQTWVNTVLGETWEERGESVGWEVLRDRVEEYPVGENEEQRIPYGAGVLVAAVDVQGDRLEWTVYAFGTGEECWTIVYGAEPGDPAKADVWLALDKQLLEPFTHASGRRMKIECVTIDSGGHHTEEVYKFCQARLGSGRRVYPVKGGSVTGLPFMSPPARGNAYKVPLYTLCTDTAKGSIYSRLLLKEPGPGYFHFPSWMEDGHEEFFQQLTAEKAIRKWVKGKGSVREWMKVRQRNEQLDLAVYGLAALYILGGGRAPVWLAEHAAQLAKPLEGPPAPEPDQPQVRVPARILRPPRRGWVNRW